MLSRVFEATALKTRPPKGEGPHGVSSMKKANMVCGIIGMVFSAAAFIKTLSFRQFLNVPVGPEFFPRYLASGLFICSLVLFLQQFWSKDKRPNPSISPLNKDIQRILLGLLIIIVYCVFWENIGFLIISPPALFVIMLLLGKRKYLSMAIFSIAATIIIFAGFRFFLRIDMPLGLLYGWI